jgi:hypothetical protein
MVGFRVLIHFFSMLVIAYAALSACSDHRLVLLLALVR